MITTKIFSEIVTAYQKGYTVIANKGGTRSTKTYSALQFIKWVMENSKKRRVITTVSHSLPHLVGGAIRDFDNILIEDGYVIDDIKTKYPYNYTINKSLHEFIGFDKLGKALGAARDILFINEANKMPFSIIHQLIIRTEELILLDWNPSEEFWFDTEKYEEKKGTKLIHSTFLDNVNPLTGKYNLSDKQLKEMIEAEGKAKEEDERGQRGYWWNWWQVYGLGKKGQLEGAIFTNWQIYENLPELEFYTLFGIDWGGNDPNTLLEIKINGDYKLMYVYEHIYQAEILASQIIDKIRKVNPNNHPVIYDSARKDKGLELQYNKIKAFGATKGAGSIIDGIDLLQEFSIFVHKDSKNTINEFQKYKWAKDKKTNQITNIPEDKNNHSIDACRYVARFYRRNIKPL